MPHLDSDDIKQSTLSGIFALLKVSLCNFSLCNLSRLFGWLRFLYNHCQDGLWEMLDSSGSTSLPLMTHAMSTAQLFAEVEDLFLLFLWSQRAKHFPLFLSRLREFAKNGQAIPAGQALQCTQNINIRIH